MSKIKRYRLACGYTQQDIANLFGITKQGYWKKEVGRSSYSDEEKLLFVSKIKEHFPDVTLEEIFFSKDSYC